MQRLGKMRQVETWRENMISEQIHWNKQRFVKQNAKQDETVQQNEAIGDLKRKQYFILFFLFFFCFNATFSNISAISWRSGGGSRSTQREPPTMGKQLVNYHLQLRVECTLFCNLQSRVRTHGVLVIGLYELLGNPTT